VYKYQQQAIRAAHLITRDLYLAEDLVQTAFVRSFERIQQFEQAACVCYLTGWGKFQSRPSPNLPKVGKSFEKAAYPKLNPL
jgi:hypothetical protein